MVYKIFSVLFLHFYRNLVKSTSISRIWNMHPGQCNREGGKSKGRKKGYTSVKFVCEQIYKEV
jgi:hypothetical protein